MYRRRKTIDKRDEAAIEVRAKIGLTQEQRDAERRLLGKGSQPIGFWKRQKHHYTGHWFPKKEMSGAMNRTHIVHSYTSHCKRVTLHDSWGEEVTPSSLLCLRCAAEFLGRFVP